MKLEDAEPLATRLRNLLAPYCERVEIAGSIRRKKREGIKDIELVAIPKFGADRCVMFAETAEPVSLLDQYLERVVTDPSETGLSKDLLRPPHWGPKSKRLRFQGVAVDLFIVLAPAQWGVIFLIRTGPSDFSRRFVTSRNAEGMKPDTYDIINGHVERAGKTIDTPEEIDLLRLWGENWIEPSQRT